MMNVKLGVVMDTIASINPKKDSTLAMLLAAQRRGFELYYMELGDLGLRDSEVFGWMRLSTVLDDLTHWFDIGSHCTQPLAALDAILMRKDPPVDSEYLFATYMLELAEAAGTLELNKPQSLRDRHENLYTALIPQCTPPTRETRSA